MDRPRIEGLEVGEMVALDAYQRGIEDFAQAERAGDGSETTADSLETPLPGSP